MKLIKSIFLIAIIGMMTVTSCTTGAENTNVVNSSRNQSNMKVSDEEKVLVIGVIEAYLKESECTTCKNSCSVIGYFHAPNTPRGVGLYHVKCSSGNEYEGVYNCDGTIDIYAGGSTVVVPSC